jgi:hypothetical protein
VSPARAPRTLSEYAAATADLGIIAAGLFFSAFER